MPFINTDSLKYLAFESFIEQGVKHGVFTRRGGISPSPWNTLNVGATVGDDQERVLENRNSILGALGLEPNSSFDVWQVHSKRVVRASSPRDPIKNLHKADAIITNVPGVSLFMRFADCVPILFYDPMQKAVGIAHAGWKGTLENIAKETIKAMKDNFNSQPADLITAIGPSISGHHYEIGPDVEKLARDCYGKEVEKFLAGRKIQVDNQNTKIKPLFDLQKANRYNLFSAGVRSIESAPICTACNLEDWFSHRGENGKTGRFGAIIVL